MSMRLLQRFSLSLLSAEYPSAADAPSNLHVLRGKVELSFNILRNLESTDRALTKGDVSPVSRNEGEVITGNDRIDPRPFNAMGIPVPTTDTEVRDAFAQILSQLQGILEVSRFGPVACTLN